LLLALSFSACAGGGKPLSPIYWTGDGGSGKSITILPPKGTGLTENLLEVIAVELVSNFTQYSAMTVFDRVNNQRQYDELLSGYYDDDDPAGLDLGHLASTDYMLLGNITRTSTGYVLQLSINRNREKTTVAVYSQTVPINVLENLTAVRQASLDLLQKMGIQNTQLARTELTRTATAEQINARTLTAQGISAQRGGTVVEALTYFYEAAAFDPTLLEAANRASALSAAITSGNIGENVRNDIQWRNEWKKNLDEAEAFFKAHLPFEVIYGSSLIQGRIDYQRETVDLSCSLEVRPTDGFKVLEVLRKGLIETGKMEEWGFHLWPLFRSTMFIPYSGNSGFPDNVVANLPISIVAGLFDKQGKQLSSTDVSVDNYIRFYSFEDTMRRPLPKGYLGAMYSSTHDSHVVDTSRFTVRPINAEINFHNVDANDITDNLVVKIISVNGIDAETAGSTGYIKISSTQ
jgi:hypothetical protein